MPVAVLSFGAWGHRNLAEDHSSIPKDLENRLNETLRHVYDHKFYSIYDTSGLVPRHTILDWAESSGWKIHSVTESKNYQTFLMMQ